MIFTTEEVMKTKATELLNKNRNRWGCHDIVENCDNRMIEDIARALLLAYHEGMKQGLALNGDLKQ